MSRLSEQLCAALTRHLSGGGARPPEAGVFLWNCFLTLSRARSYNPHGPNPISFEAVEAWSRLMRVPVEPHHVETILAMDEAWMGHAYARRNVPEGVKTLPPVSQQPITATLLDLMMG
jgi:hypothetical protein